MRIALFFLILISATVVFPPALETASAPVEDSYLSCQTATIQITKEDDVILPVPQEIPGLAYQAASRKVNWVLNHIEVMDGWSFTGYAWTRVNKNFTPYRIKVGIINADISTLTREDARDDPFWQRNVHNEQRRGVVFGISFGIKF